MNFYSNIKTVDDADNLRPYDLVDGEFTVPEGVSELIVIHCCGSSESYYPNTLLENRENKNRVRGLIPIIGRTYASNCFWTNQYTSLDRFKSSMIKYPGSLWVTPAVINYLSNGYVSIESDTAESFKME